MEPSERASQDSRKFAILPLKDFSHTQDWSNRKWGRRIWEAVMKPLRRTSLADRMKVDRTEAGRTQSDPLDLSRHIEICKLLTRIAQQRGSELGMSAPAYLAGVLAGVYPRIDLELAVRSRVD
jgi:hypothetical protein